MPYDVKIRCSDANIDGNVPVLPSSVGDGLSARCRIIYPVDIRMKHCKYKRHPTDTTSKDR